MFAPVPAQTFEMQAFGQYADTGKASTLKSRDFKDATDLVVAGPIGIDGYNSAVTGDKSATLGVNCGMATGRNGVCVSAVDCRNGVESPDVNGTLQAKANGGISVNLNNTVRQGLLVRRLTPLECERLQGFPDYWTELAPISDMTDDEYEFWKAVHFNRSIREGKIRPNGDGVYEIWKKTEVEDASGTEEIWENTRKPYNHKTKSQMVKWYNKAFVDSAESSRYKALGNSIALPSWFFVLQRLSLFCGTETTMASLFDGIGGFPLIWETLNGEGTCIWGSEIEEFPMAVTKIRFTEEEHNET